MKRLQLLCTVASVSILATPAFAEDLATAVTTEREMIVTANPLATEAGAQILKNGGTAADAMVAAQIVLGLVEPQSSGLGGGAFALYYDAETGKLTTFDAREKAPSAATEIRFVGFGFFDAWQSGLSVGVPGTVRLMEVMHERYGKKAWSRVLQPGISLAQAGFELTDRTSSQVQGLLDRNPSCDDRLFFRDPVAFAYFANPDCTAKPAGTLIRNKDYANTLKAIRNGGADAYYNGEIAEAIAAAVQNDLNIAGDMTAADLAAYEVIEREPVCIEYRKHDVCGMGPPSSGGLAVGQMLGILENFDVSGAPLAPLNVHLFMQAGRLAFADRNLYVADTDFVTVPVEGMLDKDYLASRAALIDVTMDMGTAAPGSPPGDFDPTMPDPSAKNSGTSHISIVDRYGNALSMTTTIESSFGNGVMVHGFLLNNELTDFSFNPGTAEEPVANRVQANKRPRSSMAPTIVFDENGKVELVTGSPGGSRIIAYSAQSVVNHIDFGLDPQESINTPHYMNRNGSSDIEKPIPHVTKDYDEEALQATLQNDFGYSTVNIRDLTSGLSVIHIDGAQLVGGGDQRRDGAVGGR